MSVSGKNNDIVVTVKTEKLLDILRANKTKHIADYESALTAYKQKMEETIVEDDGKLKDYIANFRKNHKAKTPTLKAFSLPAPVSHESAYEDIIGMLELHTSEEMKLDSEAYRQYVKDDWSWKGHFELINSSYRV